jgi:hypothetical protein
MEDFILFNLNALGINLTSIFKTKYSTMVQVIFANKIYFIKPIELFKKEVNLYFEDGSFFMKVGRKSVKKV